MTLAAFSYIGVEIIAVTASEAKYPRDDLPRASRRIFWTTFTLYVAAIFFVSINVPYTSSGLKDLYDTRPTTAKISPFIVAVENAGISFLPGFINAAMLFASWSTTNTELFVASRTLYGMAARLDEHDHPYLTIFKRTTKNGVPMVAIFASAIFAPLAYLQCGGSSPQKLLDVLSQMETVACLFVWACQCGAFIRFYYGWVFHHFKTKLYMNVSVNIANIDLIGCELNAAPINVGLTTTPTRQVFNLGLGIWALLDACF